MSGTMSILLPRSSAEGKRKDLTLDILQSSVRARQMAWTDATCFDLDDGFRCALPVPRVPCESPKTIGRSELLVEPWGENERCDDQAVPA